MSISYAPFPASGVTWHACILSQWKLAVLAAVAHPYADIAAASRPAHWRCRALIPAGILARCIAGGRAEGARERSLRREIELKRNFHQR